MLLEIIVLTLFIATIFNLFMNKFKIPTIIGYIITGTIISYFFGLHDMASNQDLRTIAEFGIAFLMFTIGLEFSLKHLIKMKRNVFIFGSMQFFATTLIFYGIAVVIIGIAPIESLIIGLGLSLSSTAIVLKILNENGDINKHYGNRSLGILLFQDLMVIPILLIITLLSSTDSNITLLLSKTIIGAVVLLITLWIIGKYLLDYFLYKVAKTNSNEIFIGSILFIIIGASLLAHTLGFTYSLGAFIAGLLIAETHYKHQIEADLIPFRDLLLGFFFITVGMQLNVDIIYNNIFTIIGLLTVLIFIKIAVLHFILMWFNNYKRSSFKTALSLFQFGEFTIVVFQLATMNNLIDAGIGQILTVVIIFSMIISPLVLRKLGDITNFIFGDKNIDKSGCLISKKLEGHVVLIGYGRLGKLLGELLKKNHIDYIILENNITTYKEAKKEGKPIIFGNAFQANTLKSVKIEEAHTILISIGQSEKLYLVSNVVRKMNIKGNIIVKVNNFKEEEMLQELDITNIIVESEKTAIAMFDQIKYKK